MANPLIDRPLTDTGTAECLVAQYGHRFRFCHTFKRSDQAWFEWDGSRWQADSQGAITKAIIDVARKRYEAFQAMKPEGDEQTQLKKQGMAYARTCENLTRLHCIAHVASVLPPFASSIEEFDRDPMLAGLKEGKTLELATGKVRPARQKDNLTLQLGTAYDPEAKCPRWRQFLEEVFERDVMLRRFVQRAVGYSLIGDNREQALFLCHGSGANGKSTFLAVLSALFGEYATSTAFATFDADKRTEQTEDLARLRGKRLVTVIEADEDRRLAEARVKSVTGGDPITCAYKYGHYFEYVPAFKPWLAVNHRPIIRDVTPSIWRRIKPIPFAASFTDKADKDLKDKLLAELPGILNWALDGLRLWREEGLNPPQRVLDDLADYRAENDQLAKWLEECCMVDSAPVGGRSSEAPANDAYQAYQAWAESRGERAYSQARFGRMLKEKGFDSERVRRGDDKRYITIYRGFTVEEYAGSRK